LFKQAAQQLDGILARFPPEKVQQVRSRMATYVKQGGVNLSRDKSTLEMGLEIASGKALPSQYIKSKEAIDAEEAAKLEEEERMRRVVLEEEKAREQARGVVAQQQYGSATGTRDIVSPAGKSSNVRLSITGAKTVVPPVLPVVPQPPPPIGTAPKRLYVTAIFDHEAEEQDELGFNVGDVIEVLDSSDEGWWKGTIAGRVGIFPVNYVEINK
jgi:hypothetical protein